MPDDEFLEEERYEHRLQQQDHDRRSRPPASRGDLVARFFKGLDCPDSTTADVFYIDRTTGQEVMRYDGADPANTNPYYGATPDADRLARRGYDIGEMIPRDRCVIDDVALGRLCRTSDDLIAYVVGDEDK